MSFDVSVSKTVEILQNCPIETTRGFAKHHKRLKADSKDKKKVFKIFILLIIFSLSLCFRFLGFYPPQIPKVSCLPKYRAFFAFGFWGFTPQIPKSCLPSQSPQLSLLFDSGVLPLLNSPVDGLRDHSRFLCYQFLTTVQKFLFKVCSFAVKLEDVLF